MKHISKFDGCVYDISYSMTMEDGELKDDGVIVIWKNAPCGVDDAFDADLPIMEFVAWYCGDYDYDDVEWQIKHYYREKLEQKNQPAPKKPKTMDLPICYVHLIEDCLKTIQDHNLYELMSWDKDEESIEHLKWHIEDVLSDFCKPLDELDIDTEIILED